ncbi:mandelate racemase/muconate lactonizing enzyme family protein [uncultured Arcticibacterium sp.]|uniref:mandelate racemase/muconate lactonizing enzyme family protein n=1 Tax=uncultured Arcticibacterium sp. TaxID=2173042 RepID=UPI0030FA37E0
MKNNLFDRFKFKGEIPSGPTVHQADQTAQKLASENGTEPNKGDNRRDFIRKSALGGLSLGMMFNGQPDKEIEFLSQKVKRSSSPSDLKITDLRIAIIDKAPMTCPIIRIDTNQGISGYGEIRDGASAKYGLFLKSKLLGKNPCNPEMLFKEIKQFGGHGRAAGGVCGVEMALMDLAGKAYGVPAFQMLGGKYRDYIRIYGDTPTVADPVIFAQKMKERQELGLTFLKMDFGVGLLKNHPGTVVGGNAFDYSRQWGNPPKMKGNARSYANTKHPFTGIQITDEGIEILANYVHEVRKAVGYEVPLAADHFGHFGVNTAIRIGKAIEKYQLAWLEDMIPWFYTSQWKQISDALDTPTLTGEDIFLKEEFIKLIDARAVDLVQPDLASSGGLIETKKIGDYAEERGIPMAMHFAGTPVSFMANIHCAAATENFVALEHHSFDVPWWEDLVGGIDKPIYKDGFVKVPETPGLGIDLNEKVVKEHLKSGTMYFAPTTEWDELDSHDRTWS